MEEVTYTISAQKDEYSEKIVKVYTLSIDKTDIQLIDTYLEHPTNTTYDKKILHEIEEAIDQFHENKWNTIKEHMLNKAYTDLWIGAPQEKYAPFLQYTAQLTQDNSIIKDQSLESILEDLLKESLSTDDTLKLDIPNLSLDEVINSSTVVEMDYELPFNDNKRFIDEIYPQLLETEDLEKHDKILFDYIALEKREHERIIEENLVKINEKEGLNLTLDDILLDK
ncbi:hypothetical protein [Methanosphaera sp. WGK6]|uniref:hypothetical protein n=1 Tax=Methanosphaera sp. WGK6 TaxID=1561964 RepID=UPI00084CC60E|nr:hypothetical protein [Methanosphaera sp. WGK6]OED30407.1 hypothetical protein NL43_03320 [Methanosphaera sp. WGK6]